MKKEFYVYVHKKPISNEIFYVGKGKGYRAFKKSGRNPYWNRIVKKYGFEVEIIKSGLTEKEAFQFEIDFIENLKGKLCNLTTGGEGVSGFSPTLLSRQITGERYRGKQLSEEHKKNISLAQKGKKLTKAHKKKLSLAVKGRPSHLKGTTLSESHKQKLSVAFSGENNPNFGKSRSKKTKEKISKSTLGSKNHISKEVVLLNKVSGEVKIFETIVSASDFLKISTTSLRNYFKNNKSINDFFVQDIK
jgi:group I intron endonuclease